MTKPTNTINDSVKEKTRRDVLRKGVSALAAVGFTGVGVALAPTAAEAACCTGCNGKRYCCSGNGPTCGVQ